jgi:hypothetical protein
MNGTLMDILETLLAVGVGAVVGALASLGASWILQNRQFGRQRLDKAREKVYGPLAWELEKMHRHVSELEYSPSCEVWSRIRNRDYLEWMIESKKLRTEITRLYDKDIAEYRDAFYSAMHPMESRLEQDLFRQIRAFQVDDLAIRDIEACVRRIVAGLPWLILQAKLSEERVADWRSHYERLLTLLPQLAPNTFDDYLAKVTPMFQDERARIRKSQERVLSRIDGIQQKLDKLLRP